MAPDKEGSYWEVESEGGADVKIKLLGTNLDLTGSVTTGEWDGIKKVLQHQQIDENKNYRDCVRDLLPIFINKVDEKKDKSLDVENKNAIIFNELPKKWIGTYSEGKYKSWPMVVYIDTYNGNFFSGKTSFPNNGNTITNLLGEIIDEKELDDFVEGTKWRYVDGYKKRDDVDLWVKFTFTEFIQGSKILLNTVYYAGISEYNISGVEFKRRDSVEPIGTFSLSIDRRE